MANVTTQRRSVMQSFVRHNSGCTMLKICLLSLILAAWNTPRCLADSCGHSPDDMVTCEAVEYQQCRTGSLSNITTTSFPNIYGHTLQEQAWSEIGLISPEIKECSNHSWLLICSAFFPLCFPDQFQSIEPCREMCERVRDSCLQRNSSLNWPDNLSCDRFESSADRICIYEDNNQDQDCGILVSQSASTASPVSSTDPNSPSTLLAQHCTGRLLLVNKSQSAFAGVDNCVEPCVGIYFEDDQSMLITVWSTAISFLTLLVSILVMFTYALNYKSILSLESPIYFISFCYGVVGLTNLVSFAVGREAVLCDQTVQNPFNQSILISEGLSSPVCSTIFSVSYFFTLCTWSWWIMLTIEWAVCSIKTEIFGRHWNVVFHTLAWGAPALFLLVALFTGSFSGNTITQSCWIKRDREVGFLLIPLGMTVFFCAVLCILVQARVVQLQNAKLKELRRGSDPHANKSSDYIDPLKLVRTGIYIAFSVVPMGVLFCTYFYDYWYREDWERSYLLSCTSLMSDSTTSNVDGTPGYSLQDCDAVPGSSKPQSLAFMVQIFTSLCMGFISIFWLLRQQLLNGWKRFCCALCTYWITRNQQHYDFSATNTTNPSPTSADVAMGTAVAMETRTRGNNNNSDDEEDSDVSEMEGMTRFEPIHILSDSPGRVRPHLLHSDSAMIHSRTRYIDRDSLEPMQVYYGESMVSMGYHSKNRHLEPRNLEPRGLEPIQVLSCDSVDSSGNYQARTQSLEPGRLEPVGLEPIRVLSDDSITSMNFHRSRTRYMEPTRLEPIRIEMESGTESQA